MKKVLYSILVIVSIVIYTSCKSNTDPTYEVRDYATQYAEDILKIESFIDGHKLNVDSNGDVTFSTLNSGDLSIRQQTTYPLRDTIIAQNDINYKMYFMKIDEGTDRRPTAVDSVFVSYKAFGLLSNTSTSTTTYDATLFDATDFPIWFKLQDLVTGWSYAIPLFKTGIYSSVTNDFSGYGNCVMFLPSGLAYYNNNAGSLGTYVPLIFNVKLFELYYRDHDGDKVKSKDEISKAYYESAGYNYITSSPLNALSDTDGDGVIDMYDVDDDGDGFVTKHEIYQGAVDLSGNKVYPDFDNIFDCGGVTTTNRWTRKHLNAACH